MASRSPSAMENKLSKMCRTCLSEGGEMNSIFDAESTCGNVAYSQIVAATTGVQVSVCDGLPPLICTSCRNSATLAYQFKQQSRKADVTLRNIISKNKTTGGTQTYFKSEVVPVKFEFGNEYEDFEPADFEVDSPVDVFCDTGGAMPETKKEEAAENICTLCNNTFDSEPILRSHLLTCLKGDYSLCQNAGESEEVKSSLCPLTGSSFGDSRSLLKHVFTAHNSNKKGGHATKATKLIKKSSMKITKPRAKASAQKILPLLNVAEGNPSELKALLRTCCGVCNIVLNSQEDLNSHFNVHSINGVMCCALCEKMFLETVHFKQHLLSYHPDADVKSENESMSQQIDGVLEGQPKAEEISAALDGADVGQYMRLISLEDVIATSTVPETPTYLQVCMGCGQLFSSPVVLVQHVDLEHQELSNRCNFCSKLFSTPKSAARHRKVCKHMDRKHECYTCGLKFAYELTLNKHILREHKGQSVSVNFMDPKYNQEKHFTCKTCTKSFFRQDLLDKHLRNHMPNDGMRYECDICKKRFNRKDNLRSHMQTHDPQRARAASNCLCLYCGRSFSNSSNLIVHMRRHTGEKPYKCDFCGKGFPRSSDLQCHRRSHTGEKPYLCNICGKGFRRNNKLSRHMRVHTGQRPYKCTYCEKAFSQSNDLTLHIRRHTGDKPYVCRVCGDRFIQGTALHNHRRTHNHYPPSTSEGEAASLLIINPKPITTVAVKKIIDIAKL